MRWFVRGDIDGFFGLALDNLVQLLVLSALCLNKYLLNFSPEIVHGHILPGVAVSLLVGNLFYAWQARQLAKQTGRTDICALPYGINTVSLFAHVFLVMLPAKIALQGELGEAGATRAAWQMGLLACLGSGLIEIVGAFVAERIRKATPRAALLATLAGIALGFISFAFLFRTFSMPLVGFITLGVVILIYFGGVKFKLGIPGGLVAVGLGTAIYWLQVKSGSVDAPPVPSAETLNFYPPVPVLGDLWAAIRSQHGFDYLSVILAMGIFNVVGSLQNIESAEAAGDSFPTRPSLLVNGIGSVAAACFGSCFPTTIYIGHPGWKALGARAGYSVLNGVFMTMVCLTGSLAFIAYAVPIEAGMAIVLWIGIVITAQAFQATPAKHAPAAVIGMLPGIGAWGVLMAKSGLRAAGVGVERPFGEWLVDAFHTNADVYIKGAFALEQGFIFTAMIWAAGTVAVIEKHFWVAGVWALCGAALSGLGLMHSYQYTFGDTALNLVPAKEWACSYGLLALLFFLAPVLTEPTETHT